LKYKQVQALRLVGTKKSGEGRFIVLGAFINCRDYGVMVEGIVPVSERSEQLVVNSVLESFECG
jgi:hypothetical protein